MALFSRRCLQRLLQENATFLSPKQTDQHVRLLNMIRADYLATEWEIAVMNALSKLGKVRHEPRDLGGRRFLDVVFQSPAIQFGADIATVSDEQLHKRNPVDRIWMELGRYARKAQITRGGFDVKIGHSAHVLGRGVRRDLLIPPVAKLNEVVFNADFGCFMRKVANDLSRERVYRVQNSTADITITFDPDRQFWGGTHLAYTSANILDDNPVFNTLKNKAGQLKQSGYTGLRGLILCDGGCQMLSQPHSVSGEYSARQVVGDFMRQNQSVGFVATIGSRHEGSGYVGRGRYKPVLSALVSPAHAAQLQPLSSVLNQMVAGLPTFETSAANALSRVTRRLPAVGAFFGGYNMDGNHIKMSAVALQQLLAGTISYSDFAKAHGFDERNPFANAARAGRVIRNCKIESGGEEDDDWITFEFSDPDPALAPFARGRAKPQSGG